MVPSLSYNDEDDAGWVKTQATLSANHGTFNESSGYTEYTVESGDSLILPYEGTTVSSKGEQEVSFSDSSLSGMKTYCQSELIIATGVKLTIEGSLSVGGVWGKTGTGLQGNTSGKYAQISMMVGSKIDLPGTAEVYGYIKEYDEDNPSDGIEVSGSGGLSAPVVFYDFHGGSHTIAVYQEYFPLHIFDFPNIQVYGKIGHNATFEMKADIYAMSTHNFSNFDLVAPSASALFQMSNGYFCFDYAPAKYETINTNGTSRKVGLTIDDRATSSPKSQTEVIFDGDSRINSIAVTISYDAPIIGIVNVTMTTEDKFLPMSYKIAINQVSGIMTIPSAIKIKLLPGSSYKIAEGASVIIEGEAISYTEFNQVSVDAADGNVYPNNLDPAKIILNGSANVIGGFGGEIITENVNGTASLTFSAGSSYTVSSPEYNENIGGYENTTKNATGYVETTETPSEFSSYEATVFRSCLGAAYWEMPKTITLNYEFVTTNENASSIHDAIFKVGTAPYSKINGTSGTLQLVEGQSFTLSNHYGIEKFEVEGNGSTLYSGNIGEELTVDGAISGMTIKATIAKAYKVNLKISAVGSGSDTNTNVQIDVLAYNHKNEYVGVVCSATNSNSGGSATGYVSSLGKLNAKNANNGTISTGPTVGGNVTKDGDYYIPTGEVIVTASGGYYKCLLPGTLITMGDGSYRPVEEVQAGDYILAFNHETGKKEPSMVLFNDHEDEALLSVLYLDFSGKEVGVIYEHGFFDLTLNKYVYIDASNYLDFIGHEFAYIDESGSIESRTLSSAYVKEEMTECYSPVTYSTLNYFTEDMLSMPGGISGLFNYFEYDPDTLAYDEEKKIADINEYGLFTYDDFKDTGLTEQAFDAYNGQYLKVSIGKGLITWENIEYLISRYGKFF